MRRLGPLGFACLAVLLAVACAAPREPEAEPLPVAMAGTRVVTLAELEDYLVSHLQMEDADEWEPEAVNAEVKSRLLDDLIREILLAEEAERVGLEVTAREVDAWIAGGPEDRRLPKAEESLRRERARREILAQKILASTGGAVEDLLTRLASASPVRQFPENLPFAYVPEAPPDSPP